MLITIITILLAVVVLGFLGWHLISFIRYMVTGEYEVQKRFWDVVR